MKKLFILSGLAMLLSFTTGNDQITKKERKEAISYFKQTQKRLADEIYGLTDNQLNWKPADSVWSVAECIEHITLSEKNIFDWAMSTLKQEADPAIKSQARLSDDDLKRMITDRSVKVKTREGFIPSGQFGDAQKTMAVFNERREALINYMKDTKDDLHNHFAQLPFGWIDTYQVLVFLSAHTLRHTLQIVELKSMPGFPKV